MENRHWAILLDLDQTLVLTSSLEELRQQRKWSQIYGLLHQTQLPPNTHVFLEYARKIGPLGIITTSPRPYAERLLVYHNIPIDVVVGYYDAPRPKPYPDPILIAAKKLNTSVTHCFYIGDTPNDILAATRAGVLPIGLCWDGSLKNEKIPSTCSLCRNWEEVLYVIKSTISAIEVKDEI